MSIHLQERLLVVAQEEIDEATRKQFKELTGFDLQLKVQASSQQAVGGVAHDIFEAKTESPRMENNQAIEEAKLWAKQRGLTIYKTDMKQQMMEVHFISPEIARQHEVDLMELSYRIGMPVTYAKAPKQNELVQVTLTHLPNSWVMKKNPSIHMDRAVIAVKVLQPIDEQELKSVQQQIKEKICYQLELEVIA